MYIFERNRVPKTKTVVVNKSAKSVVKGLTELENRVVQVEELVAERPDNQPREDLKD